MYDMQRSLLPVVCDVQYCTCTASIAISISAATLYAIAVLCGDATTNISNWPRSQAVLAFAGLNHKSQPHYAWGALD